METRVSQGGSRLQALDSILVAQVTVMLHLRIAT
jgi:hypothetical protein